MEILPDILKPKLKVVFCGMAACNRSAKLKTYYAGVGNKFWSTIHDIGLTPDKFKPKDFRLLINLDIGLTDLVKTAAGNDSVIQPSMDDVKILRSKIELRKPKILAFTGKRPAMPFLNRTVEYGIQKEFIGDSKIYVLPSTSAMAGMYWDVKYWQELARSVESSNE